MPAERIFKSFLSYARQDADTDAHLFSALSEKLTGRVNGMLTNAQFTIWRDSTLPTGSLWESGIEKELRSSDILIVLLTPRWIGSEWCRNEYLLFEQIESDRNVGPCVVPILGKDLARQLPYFTREQRDVYDRIHKRQVKSLLSIDFLQQNDAERTLQIEKIADDITGMVERIRENSATDQRSGDDLGLAEIAPPASSVTPRTQTEKKLDELPDVVVAKLMVALAKRGDTASAEKAGVSPEAVIQLAQRINADIDDFDQALLELERAVSVAVEVAEEGRRDSNVGDFVDAVLARIAEKSADGQFDEAALEADTAFAQWERDEAERRDAATAGGLKILEAGLKQDILRRDPVSAAARIERMVALEYPDDRVAQFEKARGRQIEWYESGRDKGLNFDLQVAIGAARLVVKVASGPDETGMALNDLGNALSTLGDRESSTARLDEAVEAYRAALLEYTREHAPLDWAMTQNNLGNTLRVLGERESGTARLDEAVEAYRAALLEYTREHEPLEWAGTQNNLGIVLRILGERESGSARLDGAVQAYRAALLERTRERVPLSWAASQNNLGNALTALGERDGDTVRLAEAAEAFRAALQEHTRERVPLDWAMTQHNLGNALWMLGKLEGGTAQLKEAVEAYRTALLEYTRERVPLLWATTQNSLGGALTTLGERESGTARLEEAVEVCCAALLEGTRERVPLQWAETQNNLGNALRALGERETGTARLDEAVEAHRAALLERTRELVPLDWATTQNNLGEALQALGERESGTARLDEAVDAYRAALLERTRERTSYGHDQTQRNLNAAMAILEARRNEAPS